MYSSTRLGAAAPGAPNHGPQGSAGLYVSMPTSYVLCPRSRSRSMPMSYIYIYMCVNISI